ncbi:unknown [Choristoneura occidentalis granulovirus]|uniref:Uncharacterized protein n=1 Tax=Choristoneura occidentalis granulovirus TaxID=364745 RepID=Q1A4R5_9BBAC|nr:unknown [Choristoneura fumiferana granulovirus]ABC61165.1 unknown [Choristoneura fumiferana granulovirus]
MMHYQITHFYYKPVDNLESPLQKHSIYVCKNKFDENVLWRGEKKQIKSVIKSYNCDIIYTIQDFDCVWDFVCKSKNVITLIGIKMFKDTEKIIEAEINRVINFEDNYYYKA